MSIPLNPHRSTLLLKVGMTVGLFWKVKLTDVNLERHAPGPLTTSVIVEVCGCACDLRRLTQEQCKGL